MIHSALQGVLVEERTMFTLVELGRACAASDDELCALVEHEVLAPVGDGPMQWRFEGAALPRARIALRLSRDLELTPAATALVLDLLDTIGALRREARRGYSKAA